MTASHTLTIGQAQKDKLIAAYRKYQQQTTLPGVEYLFILPACRITIYRTGKALFQGKDATSEYDRWHNLSAATNVTAQTTAELSSLKIKESTSDFGLTTYIGCDETGVGDYFAPLVTTACYVNPEIIEKLATYNIKDSKQLTDAYMVNIAPEIKKIVPHTTYVLPNEKYNLLVENGYNAHKIKAYMHNKALEKLITSAQISTAIPIVMDQFASPQNYRRYLQDIKPVFMPTIFEMKAENKYLAVACASILARYQFLQSIEQTNHRYQVQIPLGAGKKVDAFGKEFITKYGLAEFKKNVKWHFANTQKIME